jgi:microcystin-dependent protein
MSYTSQPTNAQSLNGIITLTDGVISIENGNIDNISNITADTATITTLNTSKINTDNVSSNTLYSKSSAGYSTSQSYINTTLLQANTANINTITSNTVSTNNLVATTSNITTLNVLDIFNLIPAGTIQMSVTNTTNPPSGWLYCRGQEVSRTTYNRLFTAIGTTFGIGDGTTTFNIPNFQGAFLRGLNVTGSAISGYTTGTIGQYKIDQMRPHYHEIYQMPNPTSTEPVAPGGSTAQDNQYYTANTSLGGKDDRGLFLTGETVPYHTMVNYLIKY